MRRKRQDDPKKQIDQLRKLLNPKNMKFKDKSASKEAEQKVFEAFEKMYHEHYKGKTKISGNSDQEILQNLSNMVEAQLLHIDSKNLGDARNYLENHPKVDKQIRSIYKTLDKSFHSSIIPEFMNTQSKRQHVAQSLNNLSLDLQEEGELTSYQIWKIQEDLLNSINTSRPESLQNVILQWLDWYNSDDYIAHIENVELEVHLVLKESLELLQNVYQEVYGEPYQYEENREYISTAEPSEIDAPAQQAIIEPTSQPETIAPTSSVSQKSLQEGFKEGLQDLLDQLESDNNQGILINDQYESIKAELQRNIDDVEVVDIKTLFSLVALSNRAYQSEKQLDKDAVNERFIAPMAKLQIERLAELLSAKGVANETSSGSALENYINQGFKQTYSEYQHEAASEQQYGDFSIIMAMIDQIDIALNNFQEIDRERPAKYFHDNPDVEQFLRSIVTMYGTGEKHTAITGIATTQKKDQTPTSQQEPNEPKPVQQDVSIRAEQQQVAQKAPPTPAPRRNDAQAKQQSAPNRPVRPPRKDEIGGKQPSTTKQPDPPPRPRRAATAKPKPPSTPAPKRPVQAVVKKAATPKQAPKGPAPQPEQKKRTLQSKATVSPNLARGKVAMGKNRTTPVPPSRKPAQQPPRPTKPLPETPAENQHMSQTSGVTASQDQSRQPLPAEPLIVLSVANDPKDRSSAVKPNEVADICQQKGWKFEKSPPGLVHARASLITTGKENKLLFQPKANGFDLSLKEVGKNSNSSEAIDEMFELTEQIKPENATAVIKGGSDEDRVQAYVNCVANGIVVMDIDGIDSDKVMGSNPNLVDKFYKAIEINDSMRTELEQKLEGPQANLPR